MARTPPRRRLSASGHARASAPLDAMGCRCATAPLASWSEASRYRYWQAPARRRPTGPPPWSAARSPPRPRPSAPTRRSPGLGSDCEQRPGKGSPSAISSPRRSPDLIYSFLFAPHPESISYSEFKTLVRKGKVSDLILDGQAITGAVATDGLEGILPKEKIEALKRSGAGTYRFVTVRVDDPGLVTELEAANVKFTGRAENTWISTVLSWVLPDAAVHGRLGVRDAAHGRRAGRAPGHRQKQGQGLHAAQHRRDVRRRGRHRRGPGRADGDRRFPQGARALSAPRRQDPEGRLDRRRARHRQDAARQGRRGGGRRAVLQSDRLGFRRDVRRRRRGAGARPLRPGPGEGAQHHLHRRAGRASARRGASARSSAATTSGSRR